MKKKRRYSLKYIFVYCWGWLCQEGLVHFCSLRWRASYEHATMKIRLIYFCNDVKWTWWCLTPLTGQEWTHCLLLLPASQCITACKDLCWNCCSRACPAATTHFCKTEVKSATSLTKRKEAARLPAKCIYYLLDDNYGQTNFPNLWGQTKSEEIGGTRMKSTAGLWKHGNDAPYCQTAKLHSQMPPSVVITNSYLIN